MSKEEILRRADLDRLVFGKGFVRRHPDGRLEHIPADEVFEHVGEQPGDPTTISELRKWWQERNRWG